MRNDVNTPRPPVDEEDERTFLQKHRAMLSVAIVVLVAAVMVFAVKKLSGSGGGARRGPEMIAIRLPPPPPTPPPAATPPPAQDIKQEQKMIEQAPVNENEEKPKDEPAPAPAISTGIKGSGGPDGFGVGGSGNGRIGGGGSGHQGSKWGWYAGQVQSSIADALRKNPTARVSKLNIKVRIWPDITGRITRIKAEPTNDPALDKAISDALTGLQLKEPPPEGMPAPIVLRISAQR